MQFEEGWLVGWQAFGVGCLEVHLGRHLGLQTDLNLDLDLDLDLGVLLVVLALDR